MAPLIDGVPGARGNTMKVALVMRALTDVAAPRRAGPRLRLRFGARERQSYPTCQKYTY